MQKLKEKIGRKSSLQIITMRSEVSELAEVNPPEQTERSCKTRAYFSDAGKPFNGHPYIFTKNKYDELINYDYRIAGKFDINEDEQFLICRIKITYMRKQKNNNTINYPRR